MNIIGLVTVVGLLGGCASQPPAPISRIPATTLRVAEVRADPERFVGAEVRWGGIIARVDNKATQTWIEVVGRGLGKTGKPVVSDRSDGRFIADFQGFADPMIYKVGDLLTVVGTLEQQVTRSIGEYNYTFPVVAVSGAYRWPEEAEPRRPDYPPPWWYYDPWPYYPPHRYPWPYPYYPWY